MFRTKALSATHERLSSPSGIRRNTARTVGEQAPSLLLCLASKIREKKTKTNKPEGRAAARLVSPTTPSAQAQAMWLKMAASATLWLLNRAMSDARKSRSSPQQTGIAVPSHVAARTTKATLISPSLAAGT